MEGNDSTLHSLHSACVYYLRERENNSNQPSLRSAIVPPLAGKHTLFNVLQLAAPSSPRVSIFFTCCFLLYKIFFHLLTL